MLLFKQNDKNPREALDTADHFGFIHIPDNFPDYQTNPSTFNMGWSSVPHCDDKIR